MNPRQAILPDVVEEHAEEATILWSHRDTAVCSPDYDLEDLSELDQRVEAHLDALRIAGEKGWETCKETGWSEAGEFFTGMSLALHSGRREWVDEVLSAAEGDPLATRGIVSAFGWVEARQLQGIVKALFNSESVRLRQLALSACTVHRVNPNAYLESALQADEPALKAEALKAAGKLGLRNLLPLVQTQLAADDEACRFWAAWSAVILGGSSALPALKAFVNFQTRFSLPALQLALRIMDPESARNWLRGLAQDTGQLRYALLGSGITGDPTYVPALIKQMASDEFGYVAGEAFAMITGSDIELENLKRDVEDENEHEDYSDDETGEVDQDAGLPLPDPDKVQGWWDENKDRFQAGQRYIAGKALNPEHCAEVLRTGYQRQRIGAALELVLSNPGTALFETRAPGFRQEPLLGL